MALSLKVAFGLPPAQRFIEKFISESDEATWAMFREKNIPVEICLTSNVLCKTATSFQDHHITRLLQVNHPIVIGVS